MGNENYRSEDRLKLGFFHNKTVLFVPKTPGSYIHIQGADPAL